MIRQTSEQIARAKRSVEASRIKKELGAPSFIDFERAPMSTLTSLAQKQLGPLHDLSVTVRSTDRIWPSGPNGSGKSTLLRALKGSIDGKASRALYLP